MSSAKFLFFLLIAVSCSHCGTFLAANMGEDKYQIKKSGQTSVPHAVLIIHTWEYASSPLFPLAGIQIMPDKDSMPHYMVTDSSGRCKVFLSPGVHSLQASCTGFRSVHIDRLKVNKGDSLTIHFYLPTDKN
ncbi:carboxypeptidase-like regulatory domain-containing protein [Chitinophaga nivalis]|uniref:Carboxypeptidase-like regulatory domain-containing protein n=1 Tax=Chitinophaga nivalis TaxID=2991709 RepID=A0ABT3IT67_9BACT|nr:carboxypeptidase-like regulatory domain-containing protein [Chitinophaga nivalis]MCW3463171.1 carboxypeptidase-like regulatory domain-containing protein [Chitinophaga nivalis]MCW3487139.1 carboxypeptidase-like regulatory domain-containing protein [Chitinophaga nivalis]